MSQSGIHYTLNTTIGGTNNLLVFYNFSGMSGRTIGNIEEEGDDATLNYAVFENYDPSINTGLYSGIATVTSDSAASAKLYLTGTVLADNNNFNLEKSNIKVTGTDNIPYSKCSVIIDFEFNQSVSDCVLMGSLEKTSTTINNEVITGAKGFNVGVNDRGKLFYQGFGANGDFIHTASSIDLAKRNVISFSLGNNILNMSRFDYLNNKTQKETFFLESSNIANNSQFFLGGSDQYFRGGASGPSGEFETANLSLNSFCLLSGYLPASALFSIGSGLIGDYFEDEGTAVMRNELTGYNQTVVYETGITGYEYEGTGSINMQTGQYMRTGNFFGGSIKSTGEGDRYFIYRSFDDALSASGVKSFVKEEVGALYGGASGYQYTPTGDRRAFDTLGLRDIDVAVREYVEQVGISGAGTVAVQLYGSRMMTGITSGVSGVRQEPVYRTVIDTPALPTSGVRLGGLSQDFKKNYIYYLGERITGVS
jgi:hypothetical protein